MSRYELKKPNLTLKFLYLKHPHLQIFLILSAKPKFSNAYLKLIFCAIRISPCAHKSILFLVYHCFKIKIIFFTNFNIKAKKILNLNFAIKNIFFVYYIFQKTNRKLFFFSTLKFSYLA